MADSLGDIPYAKELNPHVDTTFLFEFSTLLKIFCVPLLVHAVREPQLYEVALGEKPDFVNHTGEGTSRVNTTREPKDANLIPGLI